MPENRSVPASAAAPEGGILRNALAGLAVAGLLLPEAVAYAAIAGLAPSRALAAAIAGGLVYGAVGTSRFAIVSPTSSSAVLLAASVAGLAGDAHHRDLMATALTLAIGLLLVAMAACRMGSLAGFVSRPVLRGFAFGLAISIIVRQLPKLTGVAVGQHAILPLLWAVLGDILRWHWFSVALGLAALVALLALRRRPAVPGAVVIITIGIALSWVADLPAAGIALAGPSSLAMPHLVVPSDLATWERIIQLAAPISLIVFAESWGTARSLALRHGDGIGANRELGAVGLANCAAALACGMPVGAGFSVGTANEAAGATRRLAGGVAALGLLGLALFAEPLIARIPEPVLAAVVIAALTHALSPAPLVRLFRLGRDQWAVAAAALGVLTLGVLNGMVAAIALSIAELLYRLSHPSISELGRIGPGHDFVDRARHPEATRIAHVLIFHPNAPLFFANAEPVLREIGQKARTGAARVVILSLEESDNFDSTAIEALGEFAQSLAAGNCRIILARAHDRVRDILVRAGFGDLARQSTFSVADAAARASRET